MESVSDEVRRDRYTPDCLASTSFALGVFGCAVGAFNLKECLVTLFSLCQQNNRSTF